MNFLRSLLPNQIPSQIDSNELVLVLRERILQQMLMVASIMGTVFFIFSTIPALKRSPVFILIVGVADILFFSLFALRKVSYAVRSGIIIALLVFMTLGAMIIYGLEGSGILLALSCSVVAFLLRGSRTGVIISIVNSLIIAAIGVMMVLGLMPTPGMDLQYDSSMPGGWLSVGLAYLVLTVVLMSMVMTFVYGMQEGSEKQKKLSQDLTEERNMLESRVALRTQEMEKRAVQMEIASSIAHDVSQEPNIDLLLSNSVELMVQRFNLYYAAVFLVDQNREFAVLRSGSGMAGKAMLEQHHKLKIGQVGLVGFVVANNQFRLAQDVKSDPTHYENPFLPLTQSELALPLTVAGTVIGALDLQSVDKEFFSPSDIQALSIAADQIAVAIHRAQLVDQLEKSVQELESGLKTYTQSKWRSHLRSGKGSYAYHFRQSEIKVLTSRSDLAAKALDQGKVVICESAGESSEKAHSTAAIPIRLRNQILGVIEISFETSKVPGENLPILEAAADRLAIALENARLLEEVQMRAESERVVSEISSRVRSATTIDSVLKTAVAELGKSLGVAEVVVQLKSGE